MFGGAFAGVGVSSNFRCFWMPLVYWCVFKFSLCLVFFWCVGVVSSFFLMLAAFLDVVGVVSSSFRRVECLLVCWCGV